MNQALKLIKNYPGIIIITLIFCNLFVFMLPLHNLAFEDDFAYIQTAEHLYKTGELKISEWSATALVFQTYWGVLFAKIFGYSIKALIFSNVFLLYFALIAFYALLKNLLQDENRATIYSLLLIGFPWILNYAFSFMSDIFYMSLMIISAFFYISALNKSTERKKFIYFFWGSIIASLAFLNRQIGIILPISILVTLIYMSILTKKIYWKESLLIAIPLLATIYIYQNWIEKTGYTVAQATSLGPAFQRMLRISIWPEKAKLTYISNEYYIQSLQRLLGYGVLVVGFLTPNMIIFSVELKRLIRIITKNVAGIIVTAFIIVSFIIIDLRNHSLFTQKPLNILYTENVFNYIAWWPYIVLIGIPIWIIVLYFGFKKIYNEIFYERSRKMVKVFILLTLVVLFFAISHFFTIFQQEIATKPHFVTKLTLTSVTIFLQNPDVIPTIWEILEGTWFFLILILSFSTTIAFLFTIKNFNSHKTINFKIAFIVISLILELLITVGAAYYFWQNYIIQFIPLVIILFAYLTRNIKINIARATIVVCFFLLLSLVAARNRYQSEGTRWEIGTQLINSGANITNITTVSWAWRPYWLFESNLAKAISESGGDKFKIGQKLGGWENGYGPGNIIDIIELEPSQVDRIKKSEKVLLTSKPYWTFKGQFVSVAVERKQ